MVVTASAAYSAIPVTEGMFVALPASGTAFDINPGDWVAWSGQYIIAANTGVAYWKASGAGMAMDNNPAYDWAGRQVTNSALMVARYGVVRVSANFSGQPAMGLVAAPVTTGSGVNQPSGGTGVAAAWNTGTPVSVSGGTAAAPVAGVAQVIGWFNSGPAGTGQMDLAIWDRNADYY
jgi:hypothetical protein